MSSSAAAAVADAADGAAAAAAAHAPGMDDRLAALKAERQALKRQLQQASREVKAQAGQGTTSSVCAIFVLGVSRLHLTKFAPSFCTYQHLSGRSCFEPASHHLPLQPFHFISVLRQEKKRRRVLKSAGKLSTQDLTWLLALKLTRQ